LPIADLLIDLIHERGPLTVAAFMELALYHAESGYYARAAQRSGRAGDFFTSVDVGAMFGGLLEVQIAEMAEILATIPAETAGHAEKPTEFPARAAVDVFDLVEAGAGNGRLSSDILRAARRRHPGIFARTNLHLVEASAAARGAQPATLGEMAGRLVSSTARLPSSFEGVLFANELLDAFPVHQVVMRPGGLREVYVDLADSGRGSATTSLLVTREGPLSTPALAEYLRRLDISLEPGWRVEINLRAADWIREAAQRLQRGFIIVIDYGHEAPELYGVTHAGGTLTTFARHTMAGAESAPAAPWLLTPGEQDITAHVDFTTVRCAAEAEGLATLGFLDQTYFLMGLIEQGSQGAQGSRSSQGSEGAQGSWPNLVNPENLENLDLNARLALKTLLIPGGLGSTLKVLILGKGVGTPALRGCSYRMRVT
jgi:SAM-dependent MidA family methyltransferase